MKCKKGAQGVPTTAIRPKNKLMRLIANVVCLKKDDKHLGEQVFPKVAKVLEGGNCNFEKMLERALRVQMTAIEVKGQRLYTCAPIWQDLY